METEFHVKLFSFSTGCFPTESLVNSVLSCFKKTTTKKQLPFLAFIHRIFWFAWLRKDAATSLTSKPYQQRWAETVHFHGHQFQAASAMYLQNPVTVLKEQQTSGWKHRTILRSHVTSFEHWLTPIVCWFSTSAPSLGLFQISAKK